MRSEFASRLRQYRVPRGFKTARMFAQALQIDENRYTRYERAEVEPDFALLVRMCTLLGVTPNDLLGFPASMCSQAGSVDGEADEDAAQFAPVTPGANGMAMCSLSASRSLAWRIACQLTPPPAGAVDEVEPVELLRRTCRVFAEIEADPFAFAARASDNELLSVLAKERQLEIVAGLNELLGGIPAASRN